MDGNNKRYAEPLVDRTWHKVLKQLKKKKKNMFRCITKAGMDFQDAMFDYMAYTTLNCSAFGNELVVRYIHRKEWDEKLLKVLILERMKPSLIAKCPKVQIGVIAGKISSEQLA